MFFFTKMKLIHQNSKTKIPLIYLKLTKRLIGQGKLKSTLGVKTERFANKFLIVLGIVLGILGTGVTLGVV
mgnify:CR=1 FL=1